MSLGILKVIIFEYVQAFAKLIIEIIAVDSRLAKQSSLAAVSEILNGCM